MQIKTWSVCHQCSTFGKKKQKKRKKSGLNKYNPDKTKKNHQSLENVIWEENLKVLVKLNLKKKKL